MGIERIMKYECRVCGRKIDVTRTGDVYEEPVFCCGLEATCQTLSFYGWLVKLSLEVK